MEIRPGPRDPARAVDDQSVRAGDGQRSGRQGDADFRRHGHGQGIPAAGHGQHAALDPGRRRAQRSASLGGGAGVAQRSRRQSRMSDPGASLAAQRRATTIGGMAVLIWSTLALFTTATGRIPPFQLVAMAFAIAFLCALGKWIARRQSVAAQFAWPASVWALGIFGLFGYHALYFLALKSAPPATANLINYLWPLCIVLFAVPLAGEILRWWHVAGVILGLAGTAIVLLAGGGVELSNAYVI